MPLFRISAATPGARQGLRWLCAGAIMLSLGGLSGCAVERFFLEYRINVQQGNVVEQKQLALLRPGMTRDQVRYVLGTPLLQDPFHATRWDYVYRFEDGATGNVTTRNVTAYFNGAGLLERLAGDVGGGRQENLPLGSAVLPADAPSNQPQVIDLGSIPEDSEAAAEGVAVTGDSWWSRLFGR